MKPIPMPAASFTGNRTTHPTWRDPDFWAHVAELERRERETARRAAAKRRAAKENGRR